MRFMLAVLMMMGGTAAAQISTDQTKDKLEKQMSILPGECVCVVPGAFLTAGMRPFTEDQLKTIPIRDVDAACRNQNACIVSEQNAYNFAKIYWDGISLPSRNVCLASSTKQSSGAPNGGSFYKRLRICTEARMTAENFLGSFKHQHFQP